MVALINRSAYVDLVQAGQIDIAISPAQATIGTLLAHVRHGDCVAVHCLRRGAAEALELVAHGDGNPPRSSAAASRRSTCPRARPSAPSCALAAARDGETAVEHQVLIAHHDTVIEAEDHVIVFVVNKRMVPKVEKLFQVSVGFF